jgi:hypothetical protein
MNKINIKKSITKESLVFEGGRIDNIFGIVSKYFLILVYSAISIFLLFKIVIIGAILSCLTIWFSYVLLKSFKLKQIKQIGIGTKKEEIKEIINSLRLGKTIVENKNTFVCYSGISAFHWGRRVFIIFDNDILFINCTTMARYELPSVFHYYSDRRTENEIIKRIKNA